VDNAQIKRTTKWTGDTNANMLYQRVPVAHLASRRATYTAEDADLIVNSVETALA
jgi:hypothetical protein